MMQMLMSILIINNTMHIYHVPYSKGGKCLPARRWKFPEQLFSPCWAYCYCKQRDFVIWVSKEKWQWNHWIPVAVVLLIHSVNLRELFQCSESQVHHLQNQDNYIYSAYLIELLWRLINAYIFTKCFEIFRWNLLHMCKILFL